MKIKTSKLIAVLCTLAMIVATFIPVLTLTATAADTEIVFNLGANGSASHNDGTDKTSYTETVSGYTLTLGSVSKFYTGARDAKGNSCIKLGTSSAAGKFSFTVPSDVTSVVIYIGKYKSNTSKITVNGTSYTLTKNSNDGAYDEITVDTSTNKTVSLTTVSGGYRAMVNSIKFVVSSGSTSECEHSNKYAKTVEATAISDGYTVMYCDDCESEIDERYDIVKAFGYEVTFHTPNGVVAPTVDATVSDGKVTVTMPSDATLPEGNYAQEYVFAGWAEVSVDADTTESPTLYPAGTTVTIKEATNFYAVYSYDVSNGEGATESGWILSDTVEAGDTVVITMTKSGVIYALNSSNGSSSAPSASTTVTVANGKITSTITDAIKWTVSGSDGALTFHPNGNTSTWLYTTSANNGVRVGDNANKSFVIEGNYLKNTATNRYLGIYNTQDWRCYTTNTGSSNIANQTLGFYVLTEGGIETYYTSVPVTSECDHADAEVVRVEPTCTENGSITTTCSCGYSHVETIDALGHDWDDGSITTQPDCTTAGEMIYDCNNGCGETKTETIDALGHKFLDGVCTECGEELPDYSGRYYIATIRTSGNYWYMTSDLGTAGTKRYQAVDSGLSKLPDLITAPENGYVFVLEINDDGTYCIYAEGVEGDNYLGWTSGNSGILVAEKDAIKFTVDLLESGLFNIHFAGDAERYLSLNSASGSDYFAFYKGTQSQNLALIPVAAAPATAEITNVRMELGRDLALNYKVELADAENDSFSNYRIVFSLNGKEVEIVSENGEYKLNGIAPNQMGYTVTATLYKGEAVIDTLEYSIKEYLDTIVNGAEYSAEAKSLAEALLIYGAAAQNHQNDTNAPVTDKAPNVTDDDKPESILNVSWRDEGKIENCSASFKSVGLYFTHVNKIYIKVQDDSAFDVTVKVNGKDAEIVDGYVYTNAISPADFDETYTFELYINGTYYQTVEYSVNSYISAKWNDASGLAKALYNYAIAFANYQ